MERRYYTDGDVIFNAGEPSGSAFLVVDGKVRISLDDGNGKPEILGSIERGEYFGEMGVIDNQPRSATAVAAGDVVCFEVGHDEFMDMLLNRPQETIDLLKLLFRRLRATNQRLRELGENPKASMLRGPS